MKNKLESNKGGTLSYSESVQLRALDAIAHIYYTQTSAYVCVMVCVMIKEKRIASFAVRNVIINPMFN